MTDTRQKWDIFYHLADELLKAQPWDNFDDGQLFRIQYSRTEEPVYVNILGNAGNTFGLVFYEGEEGLNYYNLIRQSEDLNLPPTYALFRQNCMTIYFGDTEELPDEQYEIYMDSSMDFSDSELGIPYLLSLKCGYYPWTPDDDELESVNRWLRCFLDALPYAFTSDSWGYGMSHGYCLCDITSEDEDEWTFDYPPLPSTGYSAEIATFSEEQIKNRIRTALRSNMVIELDIYYANLHITDPKWPRPVATPLLFAVDSDSGMVIGQDLITPDDDISLKLNEVLLDTASRYGIPREIKVRSVLFADMIEEAAEIMGSKLSVCDTLEGVEEAMSFIEGQISDTVDSMMN